MQTQSPLLLMENGSAHMKVSVQLFRDDITANITEERRKSAHRETREVVREHLESALSALSARLISRHDPSALSKTPSTFRIQPNSPKKPLRLSARGGAQCFEKDHLIS